MKLHNKELSAGGMIIALIVLLNAIVLTKGLTQSDSWYRWLIITIPLLIVSLLDIIQKRKTISEYRVIGHSQLLLHRLFLSIQKRFMKKDDVFSEKKHLNKVNYSLKEKINLNNQIN